MSTDPCTCWVKLPQGFPGHLPWCPRAAAPIPVPAARTRAGM